MLPGLDREIDEESWAKLEPSHPQFGLRELLTAFGTDRDAVAELFPLVYDELRKRARFLMAGERSDHTLQPTALVHEAFVKILAGQGPNWEGRRHFYNAVTDAMRKILVDHARRDLGPADVHAKGQHVTRS